MIEERKKILDVLLMADCIPAGMEAFVATDAHYTPTGSRSKRYGSIEVKLPELFKVIATEMMDVSLTETAIKETIKAKYISISGAMVFLDDGQQIKVILNQLRVLNLIYSFWPRNERQLYWGLTEKGIKVRDDMIIIKEK